MKRIFLLVLASCLLVGQSNNANPFQPKITNGTAPNALCASGEAFFNVNTYLWSTCGPNNTWNLIGGSASSAFPSVVAKANYLAQSGNLTFNLVDNPVTGDYVLNDILQVVIGDGGATVSYIVSWMGDGGVMMNGYFSDSGIPSATAANPVAASQGTLLSNTSPAWDGTNIATPSTVIHAVSGTPISVSISISGATTLQYSYHATLVRNQ